MLRIEIMSRPQVCLLRVTDVNEAAVDLVLMQPFSTLFATLHFHNTPYLPPHLVSNFSWDLQEAILLFIYS